MVVARLGTVASLVRVELLVITSNLMFMTLAWRRTEPTALGACRKRGQPRYGRGRYATHCGSLEPDEPRLYATQVRTLLLGVRLAVQLLMGGSGSVVDQAGIPGSSSNTSLGRPASLLLLCLAVRQSRSRPGVPHGVSARRRIAIVSSSLLRAAVLAMQSALVGTSTGRARVATELVAYVSWLVTAFSIDRGESRTSISRSPDRRPGSVVLPDDASATRLAGIVALKRSAPGARVLISWVEGRRGFSDAALTEESRARFADSAVALCVRRRGRDRLDWDYRPKHRRHTRAPGGHGNFTLLLAAAA